MNFELIIATIINEPIYLSIVVIFALTLIYSILKKFFKMLIISLAGLILYLVFLVTTNKDLPGEYDEAIYDQLDSIKNKATEIIDEIKN
tara:strand:- start:4008 stop:4274 length:267 start_codon:yes stop_codon:yes gene_type:complete